MLDKITAILRGWSEIYSFAKIVSEERFITKIAEEVTNECQEYTNLVVKKLVDTSEEIDPTVLGVCITLAKKYLEEHNEDVTISYDDLLRLDTYDVEINDTTTGYRAKLL